MILDERDECFRRGSKCRCAARRFLPDVGLALKKIAVLGRGNEFLRRAHVICVISFAFLRERNSGAVMEIVVPHSVEIIATFTARSNQFGFLPLIFCEQKNRARTSRFARGAADGADDVFIRIVKNALRRIEAESIEMKLLDPVAPIGDEESADRT